MEQLELVFEESIEEDLDGILENIYQTASRVQEDLMMQDWNVRIEYLPEEAEDDVAEVTYTRHQEMEIKLYMYRPDRLYEDLAHEMSHGIVGRIADPYEHIVEVQRIVIDNMLETLEEKTVDHIARIIKNIAKRDE